MPNGQDPDDPFDFRFPVAPTRDPGFDFDDPIEPSDPDETGLPAPIIPFPTPQPSPPTGGTVASRPIFPSGAAANDPVFSQAGKILARGNIAILIATALDQIVRAAQEEQINREQFEREEVDRQIARRLGADNPLRVVTLPPDVAPSVPEFEAPTFGDLIGDAPPAVRAPTPAPEIVFDAPQIPSQIPDIVPAPIQAPAPVAPESPAPRPSTAPGPGFGIGTASPVFVPPPRLPGSFPIAPPTAFPIFSPVQFPVPQPIGDPILTSFDVPSVDSPIDVEIFDFPQAQPQPQTQPRRCKPCKEDNPKPRDKCFKGLFREGRLDTEVDFTNWVEISCETGKEI